MKKASRNKFFERHKKEHLLRWMTSFFTTAAVVTAGVVIIENEQKNDPEVRFNNVYLYGDTIYYEAEVNDPHNAIIEDTLILDVKSGFEMIRVPLSPQSYSGNLQIRYPELEYRLSIKGSQGFGQKTYATAKIKGEEHFIEEVHGAIFDLGYEDQGDLFVARGVAEIFDPRNEYTNFRLQVTHTTNAKESGAPEIVETLPDIPLTQEYNAFILDPLSYGIDRFNFKIVGTKGGVDEVISERETGAPMRFSMYTNVSNFTNTEIKMEVIVLNDRLTNFSGQTGLYKDDVLVSSKEIVYDSANPSAPNEFTFDNLEENTTYVIKHSVMFADPFSTNLVERLIESETIATAPHYEIKSTNTGGTELISFTFEILDESNVLSDFFYIVYRIEDDGTQTYVEQKTMTFREGNNPPWQEHFGEYINSAIDPLKLDFYASVTVNGRTSTFNYYSITV